VLSRLAQVGDKMVKLIVKSRYSQSLTDDAPIREVIGAERTDRYFRQSTLIKVDFDLVPEDKQDIFAAEILAAARNNGVESAVEAKQFIAPKAGFHDARTVVLTPEENNKLDEVLPIVAHPMLS
jgi:hypothetical protein